MKFDPIGMWCGENISEMSKERLLEFSAWAAREIECLEKIVQETKEYRLNKEVRIDKEKINNVKNIREPLSLKTHLIAFIISIIIFSFLSYIWYNHQSKKDQQTIREATGI